MTLRILILILIFPISLHAKPINPIQDPQNQNIKIDWDAKHTEETKNQGLASNPWQISRVFENANFKPMPDRWYFNFDRNGKYKAYGACNYISGNYKTDNNGSFKINTLVSSNNNCEGSKDEEVIIFNELLIADSFEINESTLTLKSAEHALIEFQLSDKTVNFTVAYKVLSVKKAIKPKANGRGKGAKVQKKKEGKVSNHKISKNHRKVKKTKKI